MSVHVGWLQAIKKTLPTVWNSWGERFCTDLATAWTDVSQAHAFLNRVVAAEQQLDEGVEPREETRAMI